MNLFVLLVVTALCVFNTSARPSEQKEGQRLVKFRKDDPGQLLDIDTVIALKASGVNLMDITGRKFPKDHKIRNENRMLLPYFSHFNSRHIMFNELLRSLRERDLRSATLDEHKKSSFSYEMIPLAT